jgi:hypothetical protein
MRKPTTEFLLIDAGNTLLKWATAGKKWPGRIVGDIDTPKASPTWIKGLARKFPTQPTILACVVPKLVPAFRRAFGTRLVEVTAALPELAHTDAFHFCYPKPKEIGADRLAAAVAVHAWGHYPAIIVACGTATAFTVLDEKGRFCGGFRAIAKDPFGAAAPCSGKIHPRSDSRRCNAKLSRRRKGNNSATHQSVTGAQKKTYHPHGWQCAPSRKKS